MLYCNVDNRGLTVTWCQRSSDHTRLTRVSHARDLARSSAAVGRPPRLPLPRPGRSLALCSIHTFPASCHHWL